MIIERINSTSIDSRDCDIKIDGKSCENTPVFKIQGNAGCHFCGNEVVLCLQHFNQMQEEIERMLK